MSVAAAMEIHARPLLCYCSSVRLLWISERFPPQRGGVAGAAARQAAAVAPFVERLDVVHLTDALPPGRVCAVEEKGFVVHRVGRAARAEESQQVLLQAALALGRHQRHDRVLGFYAVPAGQVAVLCGALLGCPSAVSLRGNDVDLGLFGSRAQQLQWTLVHAGAVLAVSRELLAKAALLSGRRSGLHLVRNSVDADRFSPGEPAGEHLRGLAGLERPLVLFAGELRFKKGLEVVLELAERLGAEGAPGSVVVLGGTRREEAERVARWRAAEPRGAIRLHELPYLRDPEALVAHYRAADLVILPSLWDGLPNALLEAMACARPVLAAPSGGIPEVVEHGRTGILAPIDGFADEVLRTLALPAATLASLGAAARCHVQAHFSPAGEREALLVILRQLPPSGDDGARG
jgi:phosphatidyl-myo-inositol dimannoside synthase